MINAHSETTLWPLAPRIPYHWFPFAHLPAVVPPQDHPQGYIWEQDSRHPATSRGEREGQWQPLLMGHLDEGQQIRSNSAVPALWGGWNRYLSPPKALRISFPYIFICQVTESQGKKILDIQKPCMGKRSNVFLMPPQCPPSEWDHSGHNVYGLCPTGLRAEGRWWM